MFRPLIVLAVLVPPLAAQVEPPPCTPCAAPGACAGTHPIVSGSDHHCENHSFHDHSGMSLSSVDMTQLKLSSGSMASTTLSSCILDRAMFYNVNLTGASLLSCNGDKMTLLDADATGADLTGSTFRGAYCVRVDLSGATATADFGGADLRTATFTGAVLSSGPDVADFSGADLSDAVGLDATVGIAVYDACTNFSGTGFDPVAAGWTLVPAPLGAVYCDPAVDNSTGDPAVIAAFGCEDVSANSLHLETTQLPPNQFGYFLTSETQGFVANPGGSQGNLCLGGTIGRFSDDIANSGAGGTIGLDVDLTDMPSPAQTVVQPGETWNFTTWYRDVNPTPTSNFSDGVTITFQ